MLENITGAVPRHAINFTRLKVDIDVALSSSTLRTATMKLDPVRDFFYSLSNEYGLGVLSLMLVS
jgi:hypothetical protein